MSPISGWTAGVCLHRDFQRDLRADLPRQGPCRNGLSGGANATASPGDSQVTLLALPGKNERREISPNFLRSLGRRTPGENGPLTPALSPSEGERGNRRQRVCNGRFSFSQSLLTSAQVLTHALSG